MIFSKERLKRQYNRALNLYPRAYREEYAAEMQTVFEMRLVELSGAPGWELIKFSLRELRDLPFGLLAAYRSERNRQKMKNPLERWFVQEPGSAREILLAILPFLLTAFVLGLVSLIPEVRDLPLWAGRLILLTLAFVQVVIGIIGLVVRLPRWSLTYAGVLVGGAPFTILTYLYNLRIIRPPVTNSMFLSTTFLFVGYLVVLFLLLMCIVWAARMIKRFRPFADRLKIDKTLLPFMTYGSTLVFMIANYEFDDTMGGGVHLMLSALAMILGAGFYLRQKSAAGRMAALALGNTVALFIALLANLKFVASYSSDTLISLGNIQVQMVAIYLFLAWIVCQVMIFMPLLIGGKANHSTENSQPAAA